MRKPDDYRELIVRTGGMEGNICAGQYDSTLEQISKNMHPVARVDYELGFTPEEGSLVLEVDGQAWTGPYTLSGRQLRLTSPLPEGTKVLGARYRHNAVALSRSFPLSRSADPSTLVVTVNGKTLSRDQYQLEKNEIVLRMQPEELARIEVSYRVAQDLPRIFELPKEALLSSVEVAIEDEPTRDFQIVGEEHKAIVLATAPRDGAGSRITYETKDTRVLSYEAMRFEEGEVGEVHAYDRLTQVEIPVKAQSGEVRFEARDVVNGRLVDVVYALNAKSQELNLELARTPIEGSLSIRSSGKGSGCIDNLSLKGTVLTFPCPSQEIGRLQISYDYISAIDSSFAVGGNYTPSALWVVRIDGAVVEDYVREKNVIRFPGRGLTPETRIEVEVWELVNN